MDELVIQAEFTRRLVEYAREEIRYAKKDVHRSSLWLQGILIFSLVIAGFSVFAVTSIGYFVMIPDQTYIISRTLTLAVSSVMFAVPVLLYVSSLKSYDRAQRLAKLADDIEKETNYFRESV